MNDGGMSTVVDVSPRARCSTITPDKDPDSGETQWGFTDSRSQGGRNLGLILIDQELGSECTKKESKRGDFKRG